MIGDWLLRDTSTGVLAELDWHIACVSHHPEGVLQRCVIVANSVQCSLWAQTRAVGRRSVLLSTLNLGTGAGHGVACRIEWSSRDSRYHARRHPSYLAPDFPAYTKPSGFGRFSDRASFSPQFPHHAQTLELASRSNGGGNMLQGGMFRL